MSIETILIILAVILLAPLLFKGLMVLFGLVMLIGTACLTVLGFVVLLLLDAWSWVTRRRPRQGRQRPRGFPLSGAPAFSKRRRGW